MSSQGITNKDSSAELDVALGTVKEAAGIPLPESTSNKSMPIRTEIVELRDEAQTLDEVLDGARDGAEEAPEDVSLPSLAPSLAQSLAPSLASVRKVADAVTAAAIQCLAPTEPRSDHGDVSSKSATAKEVVEDINDEVESPAEEAAATKSDPVAVEAPVQDMPVLAARSGSRIKPSKSPKSNMSSVEENLMEDSSCSGKISKASHQSKASKKSVKGTGIEGKGENTQGSKSVEVSATNLKEGGEKKKQKKKFSFFFNTKKSKTKKSGPKKSKTKKSGPNNLTKKGWLKKKHSQPKKKQPEDIKSPAAESTKVEIGVIGENSPVRIGIIHPLDAANVQSLISPSTESFPIDTPAEPLSLQVVDIIEVTKTESRLLGTVAHDVFDTPATESTPIDTPAESLSLQVVDIVEVTKSESVEKQIDSTKDVQVSVNAPAVETSKPTSDTNAAEGLDVDICSPAANATKGLDVDICSPAAILGSVNCWIQQVTGQEPVYGSANISVANSDETEKEGTKIEPVVNPSIAEMIHGIAAKWLPAQEEQKQNLNEEIAADISQAVNLLNSQRALIKEAEKAIKREESITEGSQRLNEFKVAEENKARLIKELSVAKQLEKAAKELVHHLFNSLTAKDRLEAIRLSDDIAKAEKEAAEDDVIDFGCMQIDPYVSTVKAEYDDACFDDEGSYGGNIRVNNSKASLKFPTKKIPFS
eukprot:scaffold25925_cov206-Skeletonema_menzelii.AAC.3